MKGAKGSDCIQISLFDSCVAVVEPVETQLEEIGEDIEQEPSQEASIALVLEPELAIERTEEEQLGAADLPPCPLLIACLDLQVRAVSPSPAADWFYAKVSYYRQMQIKVIESGIAETNTNGGTPILHKLERRRHLVCYLQTHVDQALHQLANLGESHDAT